MARARSSLPSPSLAAMSMLAAALVLWGCSDRPGGDIQGPAPVTQVSVTAPDSTIDVGQTVQLTATARDAGGTVVEGSTFEWTSGNETVASVSPSGLITGLAAGQAEIRATTQSVSGSLAITVSAVEPPPPPGPVTLALQSIASGLNFPVGLVSPPGDGRLFIPEKAGAIRIIKDGAVLPTPFLDLTSKVKSDEGEMGLLGIVFYPDFATSGRFIVHYNDLAGDTRVSLFRVSADPDRADPASETLILAVPQPGVAHKGGQLVFGADGFLYIGLGDGADNDQGRGQSITDLLGNILRLDVSAGSGYTVPPDNPFVGRSDARPEIWSYGFRNPWRFSFDPATGDLYIGDVGESDWEELNYASAADGAGRGVNYGWSRMEGTHCFGRANCDQTGLTLPVLEYSHSEGCSIIGGYVYRGSAIPGLQGTYLYSDFCQGWVHSLKMVAGAPTEEADWPALRTGGQVTSLGQDAAGELYLVTRQGGVFRIVAP